MRRRSTVFAVLLALAIVPYFIDLGGSAIWDANEAFYVETPRQMMERGDYITPSFNDEPRINKPVLSYWIVAAFYHVFGVSVGVERLTIALGAMVIIVCGAVLGRISAYQLGAAGRGAALLAALGLASLPRLLMLGRRIFIDVWITAFTSLTLVFFALSERLSGAASALPRADVRRRRARRVDEGAGRGGPAGAGVPAVPADPP